MTKRRQAAQLRQDQSFKGRQFNAEVILWAVRWYLMFPISYRDLELMLLDRGLEVDHTGTVRISVLLHNLALIRVPSPGGCDDVSGGHPEQSGDELCLGPDIAAADVLNLPFPDHRHRLVTCQGSSGRPEATKSKPRAG